MCEMKRRFMRRKEILWPVVSSWWWNPFLSLNYLSKTDIHTMVSWTFISVNWFYSEYLFQFFLLSSSLIILTMKTAYALPMFAGIICAVTNILKPIHLFTCHCHHQDPVDEFSLHQLIEFQLITTNSWM